MAQQRLKSTRGGSEGASATKGSEAEKLGLACSHGRRQASMRHAYMRVRFSLAGCHASVLLATVDTLAKGSHLGARLVWRAYSSTVAKEQSRN